jgi:hypothetical protein
LTVLAAEILDLVEELLSGRAGLRASAHFYDDLASFAALRPSI